MIDEKFIQSQKKLIEQKISELEGEIKESRKYKDLGSSDEDKTHEFEKFEEDNAIARAAQQELEDLKCALKRAEDGKYGYCAKCNQPIEMGRLKGYLGVIYCSTHASQE